MSLKISNLATPKQRAFLQKLGYAGRGQYALEQLSFSDASSLIEELLEEQRLSELDDHYLGVDYDELFLKGE